MESGFICPGWPVKSADLANKLQRRSTNLLVGYGRIEVKKHFDVAAHRKTSVASVRQPIYGLLNPLIRRVNANQKRSATASAGDGRHIPRRMSFVILSRAIRTVQIPGVRNAPLGCVRRPI